MIIRREILKTLTMNPIDVYAPRQSPFVIALSFAKYARLILSSVATN